MGVRDLLAKARGFHKYMDRVYDPTTQRYRYVYPTEGQHAARVAQQRGQGLDVRDPNVRVWAEQTGAAGTGARSSTTPGRNRRRSLAETPDDRPSPQRLDLSDPTVRAWAEQTGLLGSAPDDQAPIDPHAYEQNLLLSARIRRAGQGAPKPGHKYLHRQWDVKRGRYRYVYAPLAFKDRLAAQRGQQAARIAAVTRQVEEAKGSAYQEVSDEALRRMSHHHPSDRNLAAARAVWDEEQAIRALPYENAAIVSQSGQVLYRKQGSTYSVGFNAFECQYMRGAIFTHNHPEPYSFSPADIETAILEGIVEVRACDKQHRHTMSFPNGATAADWARASAIQKSAMSQLQILAGSGAIDKLDYERHGWHMVWTAVASKMNWNYTRDPWDAYRQDFSTDPDREAAAQQLYTQAAAAIEQATATKKRGRS